MPCLCPQPNTARIPVPVEPLPRGWTVVGIKEAAKAAGVDERTMLKRANAGKVYAFRFFEGEGHWRVVLTAAGFPADPPTPA